MARITLQQLDTDLVESITADIKKHVYEKCNMIPVDRSKIIEAINGEFLTSIETEIKHYYDGLFDDADVEVGISVQEYAELI